jgi:hypothetical protein
MSEQPISPKLSATMKTATLLKTAIRSVGPGLMIGKLLLAMTAPAATIDISASEDVWIRSAAPNTTYDFDMVSVRNLAGEVRYGLIQFDLSPLVGQVVTNVELILQEVGSVKAGADANYPIVSAAYSIGTSSEVPDLLSMTWNTYQATYEGQEGGVFGTLGVYNLAANGTAYADRSTFANGADRALVQAIVNSSPGNVLTVVLKPVNENIAHAFGDGESAGNNAILRVTTGTNEPPVVVGITAQPGNTNLPINTALTLTAQVSGTAPLTYQWLKNLAPISNATNNTFAIGAIVPTDAGDYRLAVSGPGGATTSAVVAVTVNSSLGVYDFPASEDVWIRDFAPGTTYNGDLLEVRRTIDASLNGVIEVRYGLVQFDLTALARLSLNSVELILDEMGSSQGAGSSAAAPIQTAAFAIGTSHNAPNLLSINWNSYTNSYEGFEPYTFATLGVYDLPDNGALRTNRSTLANAADLAFIQSLVNATNKLTLVFKPLSPGTNIAHSFGDGEYNGNNAILRIVKPVGTSLPVVSPISVLPGSSNIPVGRKTTLGVTATGTGGLTYQWRFNGQDITNATSATYVLDAIQPNLAGPYTVQVTDFIGSTVPAPVILTVDTNALQIECAEDVWIRQSDPDKTYNGDFLDVRRSSATEVRYGLVQFDLSAFAGKTVTGVELILDEMGTGQGAGSSAALPIQTVAFAIGASNNAPDLLTTTWNTYQASYEGLEDFAFATLGAYNLTPNGSVRADRSTFAGAADVGFVQQLVSTANKLTLVLKPTASLDQGHSFGDGEYGGNNAKLVVTAGTSLVATHSGSNVVLSWPGPGWALQFASALNPPASWTNVAGSTLTNQYVWRASSGKGYFRLQQ